ncbi:MAG: hypothetical protein K2X48_20110 [Chitinophagaceae bacterium]|nr:hypothetical protein [Chitinophagaceae bacterium]
MKVHSSLICFVIFLFASCSIKGYVFDGTKLKEVQVTDMGDLYSDYIFSKTDKEELAQQIKSPSLIDQVITYSKEKNWPEAVNTLEDRLKVRATLMKYRFYKVATVGNKTILAVPAEKNRKMPPGFVPAGAMFMIFKSSAVVIK